jgi:hypothetical protein
MKTGTIKFNVTQRGRKHRGVERNFDTATLASVVNSPEVQERVRKRDLHGYFGHGPRAAFGMSPPEFAVVQGKQIVLEPALVTTLLKADGNGNIEHEAEFLDNPPGRAARRLWDNKVGGFSSAISCREYGGRDVPLSFHGFDYVLEPNFSTNRGWALDSATHPTGMVLDDAILESTHTLKVLDGLYTDLQGDYDRALAHISRVQQENEELLSMLAGMTAEQRAALQGKLARLDSTQFLVPGRAAAGSTLQQLASDFSGLDLPGFEATPEGKEERTLTTMANRFASRIRR